MVLAVTFEGHMLKELVQFCVRRKNPLLQSYLYRGMGGDCFGIIPMVRNAFWTYRFAQQGASSTETGAGFEMKLGNQARESISNFFYGAGFLLWYYSVERLSIFAMILSVLFLFFGGVIVRLALKVKADVRDLIWPYLYALVIGLLSFFSLGNTSIAQVAVLFVITHLATVVAANYINSRTTSC
ncbi:hypothetical protein [Gemmobacter denitrificans]|uniref:Uncharacterized protein n=1 Tax=Gemmobacter denitrificans TaxID=3123040 RepID=A0ABU8C0J7_9RHOB